MRPTFIAAMLAAAGTAHASDTPAPAPADAEIVVIAAGDAPDTCCADCPRCSGRDDADTESDQRVIIRKRGDAGAGDVKVKTKAFLIIIEDGEARIVEIQPDDDDAHASVFRTDADEDDDDDEDRGVFLFRGRPGGMARQFGDHHGMGGFMFRSPEGEFEFDWDDLRRGLFNFWEDDDDDRPRALGFLMRPDGHDDDDANHHPHGQRMRLHAPGADDDHTDAPDTDRPRLGVMIDDRGEEGLAVAGVMDGMPAERAGLESGDVIVEINGDQPATMQRLQDALRASTITLVVLRDGDRQALTIDLDDHHPNDDVIDREARARLRERLGEREPAFQGPRFNLDGGLDEDTTEAARRALHEALSGVEMPREAREQLHRALQRLGGAGPDRPRAERERVRVERRRAEARTPRDEPGDDGVQARLEALEARLARIERALEKLSEKH